MMRQKILLHKSSALPPRERDTEITSVPGRELFTFYDWQGIEWESNTQ